MAISNETLSIMSNLYEALHPKQIRFYNKERRKFIAQKRLPGLLREEKKCQDEVSSTDSFYIQHILETMELIEMGLLDHKMLLGALDLRDVCIDGLFVAMQNVVNCERVIQK
jgi:hypothetical protein